MNSAQRQVEIPAVYMRGGSSKGVFFLVEDLPADPLARDAVLLRVIGSPDPYEKQLDGMGGATSSTSKIVIVSKSRRPGCDVEYWFGQVAIDRPLVDWSGNCGNLTSAVGPFAINKGLVDAPHDGMAVLTLWQANVQKRIVAHVPMRNGQVQELGDFELDGVAFPAAEIRLEYLDLDADDSMGDAGSAMFPTGNTTDVLSVPGVGEVTVTLINAGNPAIFIAAETLGLSGAESPEDLNKDAALLARFEAIRAHGAVAMGLAQSVEYASLKRQHTPKIAFFGRPASYMSSSGKRVQAEDIDLLARIVSMGKLHHAMTGTGAVAIAAAAAIPGTVVNKIFGEVKSGIRFGHPSGTLAVGAHAQQTAHGWSVSKAVMSRSARRLMEGSVLIPQP